MAAKLVLEEEEKIKKRKEAERETYKKLGKLLKGK